MSKQLILQFDTGDRDVCRVLSAFIDTHYQSLQKKVASGNFGGARNESLKIYQILTGMNPVRPFVRDCMKRTTGGGRISTDEAYAAFERRVRQGLELSVKKNVFGANLRRAIDEEFSLSPSGMKNEEFEGVALDVR